MKTLMILLASTTAFAGTAVHAETLSYGAASLVTIRGCNAGDNSADIACYAGSSANHRIAGVNMFNYDGGEGQSISNVDYTGVYGESKARSQYTGALSLPELGVATSSSTASATAVNGNAIGGFRLGSHALNYQIYDYDGASSSPFSLQVDLHYIVSGASSTTPGHTFDAPDGGGIVAELIVFDPTLLFAPIAGIDYPDQYGDVAGSQAEALFDHVSGAACQPGVLGYASAASSTAGEFNTSFKLNTAMSQDGMCTDTGQPLTLAAGQKIGVMAILHSYSSRGGFADSYGTMTVALDTDLPPEVYNSLTNSIVQSDVEIPDVPEPAMLGLFGMGALALLGHRRRK